MTLEELTQLKEMSRPDNDGRLATHELLCKILLEQHATIEELKQTIVQMIRADQRQAEVMEAFMMSVAKAVLPKSETPPTA